MEMRGPARSLYLHLLVLEWNARGEGLPADFVSLSRMTNWDTQGIRKYWPDLKPRYVEIEGKLHNERLRSEYRKALQRRDNAKSASQKRRLT